MQAQFGNGWHVVQTTAGGSNTVPTCQHPELGPAHRARMYYRSTQVVAAGQAGDSSTPARRPQNNFQKKLLSSDRNPRFIVQWERGVVFLMRSELHRAEDLDLSYMRIWRNREFPLGECPGLSAEKPLTLFLKGMSFIHYVKRQLVQLQADTAASEM